MAATQRMVKLPQDSGRGPGGRGQSVGLKAAAAPGLTWEGPAILPDMLGVGGHVAIATTRVT